MPVYVVIMAGGRGERLWPLSTPEEPKQLHCFGTRMSLLRSTFERAAALTVSEHIYVVTGEGIAAKVLRELPELPPENVLVEPVGRNTAPCIAYAAAVISRRDPEAVMAVFPSDHLISDPDRFTRAISFGIEALKSHPGLLITLGMVPDHPETGYGYIAPGDVMADDGNHRLHRVTAFREKPDADTAQEYIRRGYLWNAGMFLWRVDTIIEAFRVHLPGMHHLLTNLISRPSISPEDVRGFYDTVDAVSIDYGVMEKATEAGVIPAEFGWSDIGSWDALGKALPGDGEGNVTAGEVLLKDSTSSVAWSTQKRVVLLGVSDLVVIEGKDAILVCPRKRSQDVGSIARIVSRGSKKD